MSFWTDIRDTWEKGATLGAYDPEKSRENDRDQRDMVNAQMKAYKDQTELTREQLNKTQAATDAEKRRVEEKQIRSMRRNYRAPNAGMSGMLGTGEPATGDMNNNLGG